MSSLNVNYLVINKFSLKLSQIIISITYVAIFISGKIVVSKLYHIPQKVLNKHVKLFNLIYMSIITQFCGKCIVGHITPNYDFVTHLWIFAIFNLLTSFSLIFSSES